MQNAAVATLMFIHKGVQNDLHLKFYFHSTFVMNLCSFVSFSKSISSSQKWFLMYSSFSSSVCTISLLFVCEECIYVFSKLSSFICHWVIPYSFFAMKNLRYCVSWSHSWAPQFQVYSKCE